MPFIPHDAQDVQAMLAEIGAADISELFDEIPRELTVSDIPQLQPGLSELAMNQYMAERAAQDDGVVCFAGGGCYDHHIPAAVWDITTRGEFMTAYTPYQAEASQGTLQLIYEFQSMMTALTGMEVSNASVYDGASAVGEAVLMAMRVNRKSKSRRVLVCGGLHPHYLDTARNLVGAQGIELVSHPVGADGLVDIAALEAGDETYAAVIVQQPNFFGLLENVDRITQWAHAKQALVIAVVNPLSLALLKPPGEWGESGVDIVVGDGQPMGVPMASGGPSFGFMCCRQKIVRQMPGRIIGRTEDLDGKPGFTLTLQAREQHIRRAKATSNICTNQGLLVTAATIHMSLLGGEGLKRTAAMCNARMTELSKRLCELAGVELVFAGQYFHERVFRLPKPANEVVAAAALKGVLPGIALGGYFPELADCLLVCATEKRTDAQFDQLLNVLGQVLEQVL